MISLIYMMSLKGLNVMKQEYKVGIIGATGYVGVELVRILLKHP